ncbi:MAG TPA: glycosyltransferase [Planctomycetota bacterium]|nr:glycosyltransferase [Planctomycetota bacterium]
MQRHRDACAAARFNVRQIIFYFVMLPSLFLLGFTLDDKIAFTVLTFALCGFYGLVIFFRLFSVLLALVRSGEHRISAEELAQLHDEDLPIYTILVPMYKEPEIAQKIAKYMGTLDYPKDKLNVKLLLEEDDLETRGKIDEIAHTLPSCVEVVLAPTIPKGQPRTKPRACNWGLERARGKYLVIFDAEDQPEPDQLKKAVVAFRKLEAAGKKHVVCLQAKLNYFNARQNALTRFFTLEYTNWFDLFLPGLHAVRTPIPLGGTSNHFHTEVLQRLGGWDPFNVTEDCDLGIRLARQGFTTEILDSTTWEEANSRLSGKGSWIPQRSRWIKGYYQTHLVHTRDSILPMMLMAALFFYLGTKYTTDTIDPLSPAVATSVQILRALCCLLGATALVCGVYSFVRMITRKRRRMGEALLTPWKSITFRFTVGGMSMMLLLNVVFWFVTTVYLLREPIATHLPSFIGEARPFRDPYTVRENLRGWTLWHENVTDELYVGANVYNTFTGWMSGRLSADQASRQFRAIDDWSLISQLFYPVAMMLFIANFVFVLLGLLSCHKRKIWDLFPFALLMPFYWVLISIAAIKAFYQLFTNPWHWEKSQHGFTTPEVSEPPGPAEPPTIDPSQEVTGVVQNG